MSDKQDRCQPFATQAWAPAFPSPALCARAGGVVHAGRRERTRSGPWNSGYFEPNSFSQPIPAMLPIVPCFPERNSNCFFPSAGGECEAETWLHPQHQQVLGKAKKKMTVFAGSFLAKVRTTECQELCGPSWKMEQQFLKILIIKLPCDPAIPLLGAHPQELKAGTQTDICT